MHSSYNIAFAPPHTHFSITAKLSHQSLFPLVFKRCALVTIETAIFSFVCSALIAVGTPEISPRTILLSSVNVLVNFWPVILPDLMTDLVPTDNYVLLLIFLVFLMSTTLYITLLLTQFNDHFMLLIWCPSCDNGLVIITFICIH